MSLVADLKNGKNGMRLAIGRLGLEMPNRPSRLSIGQEKYSEVSGEFVVINAGQEVP